jgi:N-acetylneuraminic acid mutarotase
VRIGNKIYRFGGHHEITSSSSISYNDLHSFDTTTNTYSLIIPSSESIPSPRTWHAYSKIPGSKFLIFGGGNFSGFSIDSVDDETWIYDKNENTWTKMNPTGTGPSPRITASATLKDENVYIFGGVDITFNFLNDMYIYDTEENHFSVVEQSGDIPPGVSDPRLEVNGGYIYLQGGEILDETGIGNLEGIYRFKIQTGEWTKLEPSPDLSPSERDAQVFSKKDEKIWMFGGDVDGPNFFNLMNDMWYYDISENEWVEVFTDISPPPSKRNSFDFQGNDLYVFINVIGPESFGPAVESQQIWKFTP